MPEALEVKRGQIYDVDWGEESGPHPALIIQNDIGNRHSDYTIVAYITSTPAKQLPILVSFSDDESSLHHGGTIDLGRIMTILKTMLFGKPAQVTQAVIPRVNKAILESLGIESD